MGVNPLIFVLITLTKLWTTNGEIMAGPVPVPVDSPIDESCRNSLAGLAISETLTELPTKSVVPDGQPSDMDSIFSKVFNSYNNKDSGEILPSDVSTNSMQNLGVRSLNALDSGLKPSNGFAVLPLETTKTMNCKDIVSLLLGRNLPKRTTQLSGAEYAVYDFNNPFKRAIDMTPKLYLQQFALRPVAFTNTPNMEERVFNPNALFVPPVNQFLPPLVNFMNVADSNDIGARSLINPTTTDLNELPISESYSGIDDIAGRMLMNPNIIELAKPSIPAKRNSDIVDDIQGRMLTNPNIIELAEPSIPTKRNSDIVDDIESRMLTNPNIIELAKPSIPTKRNSDIVDDIEGRMLMNPNIVELGEPSIPTKRNSDIIDEIESRMLSNPNIIELAKPSIPTKRNSDVVDDIEGRMLTNSNIIEFAKPSVPTKRNSDIDDIEGRMLTNPIIIELSKTPVVNIGQKRSLADPNEASSSNRNIREQTGFEPLGVSPSLDTSTEKGVDEIAQRMFLFPNVIDFAKPQDSILKGFLPNEASKLLFNGNNDSLNQQVSESPYKTADNKLDISLPTSNYTDSVATNTSPVAITDGEINNPMLTTESNIPRLPSSSSLSNLEGSLDVISGTTPGTVTEGTNLEVKTDSISNINPVSDNSESNVEARMDNIPIGNLSPVVEERTNITEVNIEGRMDTFDSSSKPEDEPPSGRKARMDTKDLTDTLRSNESPMSNMEELFAIPRRMDDTGTQISDRTNSNPINSSVLSTEYIMDELTRSGNSRTDSTPNINPVSHIEGRMYDLSQEETTIGGKIDSSSSGIQPLKARTKDSVSINDPNLALNFSPLVPVEIKIDGSVPDYNIPVIAEKVESSLSNVETNTYPPLSTDGRMNISESVVEGKIDSTSNNNSAVIPEARMDDTAADIEGRMDISPSTAETQELKSVTEKDNVPELRSDFPESTDESTLPAFTVGSSR